MHHLTDNSNAVVINRHEFHTISQDDANNGDKDNNKKTA